MENNQTPRFWTRIFKWLCHDSLFEELQGDLEESFVKNTHTKGPRKAKAIYRKEVLKMVRGSIIDTKLSSRLINCAFVTHCFRSSYRSLMKQWAYSLLNIVGFAAALSICLFCVNAIYSNKQLDQKFSDKERIYRVNTHATLRSYSGTWATSQIPLYEKIKEAIPEADKIAIIQGGAWAFDAFIKGTKQRFQLNSVNQDFLKVLDYDIILGSAESIHENPANVIITERLMDKYFDKETVIGSSFGPYIVSGVMETPNKVSHLDFDVLNGNVKDKNASLFYSSWAVYQRQQLYIKSFENAEPLIIQNKLNLLSEQINKELDGKGNMPDFQYILEPLNEVASSSASNNQGALLHATGQKSVIWLMLILLGICTFNYTNLAMSSALTRTKEVAVRKVMGSKKTSLILQFLTETILLSTIAFGLGLLFFKLLAPEFSSFSSFYFQTDLGFEQLGVFFLFSLSMGLISGLIPGLTFSNISVLQLFKTTKSKSRLSLGHLKKLMVIFQMSVSLFVFIFGYILIKQSQLITGQKTPFSGENLIADELPRYDSTNVVFKNEVARISGVKLVSRVEPLPFVHQMPLWGVKKQHSQEDHFSAEVTSADTSFLRLVSSSIKWYGAPPKEIKEPFFLVNEVFAKEFSDSLMHVSEGKYSLGAEVYYPVLGRLENLHGSDQALDPNPAAILIEISDEPSSFIVQLEESSFHESIKSIESLYHQQFPKEAFQPLFLDDMLDQSLSEFSSVIKAILFIFSAVIVITIMGQIGMSMYLAKSRQKEIGIRKVLGTNVQQIINLILKSTYLQLVVATVLACPIAFWVYNQAVPSFTVQLTIEWQHFATAVVTFALLIASLIIIQTWSTSNSEPVDSLRNE